MTNCMNGKREELASGRGADQSNHRRNIANSDGAGGLKYAIGDPGQPPPTWARKAPTEEEESVRQRPSHRR